MTRLASKSALRSPIRWSASAPRSSRRQRSDPSNDDTPLNGPTDWADAGFKSPAHEAVTERFATSTRGTNLERSSFTRPRRSPPPWYRVAGRQQFHVVARAFISTDETQPIVAVGPEGVPSVRWHDDDVAGSGGHLIVSDCEEATSLVDNDRGSVPMAVRRRFGTWRILRDSEAHAETVVFADK